MAEKKLIEKSGVDLIKTIGSLGAGDYAVFGIPEFSENYVRNRISLYGKKHDRQYTAVLTENKTKLVVTRTR